MTKAAELREMSDEQLALTLKEAMTNLFHLRLQSQTERLDAPSELRKTRQLIARVRTIQTERANQQRQQAEHQQEHAQGQQTAGRQAQGQQPQAAGVESNA